MKVSQKLFKNHAILKVLLVFSVIIPTIFTSNTHAAYDENATVNNGVVVKLSTKDDKTVKTGETHQITLKTSYSNPNDKDYAKIRLYLQNKDGTKVSDDIKVLNLVDDKLIFSLSNNKDLSVEVNHVVNNTERYLEFQLPPGTSLDMEIELKTENGFHKNTEVVLHPVVVSPNEDNNKVSEDLELCWEGEFSWKDFHKQLKNTPKTLYVDGNTLKENIMNTSTINGLKFDFNITNANSTFNKAVIFAKRIETKDIFNLPEGMTFKEGSYAISSDKKSITIDSQTFMTSHMKNEIIKDFAINESRNQLTVNFINENTNQKDEHYTKDMSTVYSSTDYDIQFNVNGIVFDNAIVGYKTYSGIITNQAEVTVVPVNDSVEPITMQDRVEIGVKGKDSQIKIEKDYKRGYVNDKDKSIWFGTYTLKVSNVDNKNYLLYDILPEGVKVTSKTNLKYGHVDEEKLKSKHLVESDIQEVTEKDDYNILFATGSAKTATYSYNVQFTKEGTNTYTNQAFVFDGNIYSETEKTVEEEKTPEYEEVSDDSQLEITKEQIGKYDVIDENGTAKDGRFLKPTNVGFNLMGYNDELYWNVSLTNKGDKPVILNVQEYNPIIYLGDNAQSANNMSYNFLGHMMISGDEYTSHGMNFYNDFTKKGRGPETSYTNLHVGRRWYGASTALLVRDKIIIQPGETLKQSYALFIGDTNANKNKEYNYAWKQRLSNDYGFQSRLNSLGAYNVVKIANTSFKATTEQGYENNIHSDVSVTARYDSGFLHGYNSYDENTYIQNCYERDMHYYNRDDDNEFISYSIMLKNSGPQNIDMSNLTLDLSFKGGYELYSIDNIKDTRSTGSILNYPRLENYTSKSSSFPGGIPALVYQSHNVSYTTTSTLDILHNFNSSATVLYFDSPSTTISNSQSRGYSFLSRYTVKRQGNTLGFEGTLAPNQYTYVIVTTKRKNKTYSETGIDYQLNYGKNIFNSTPKESINFETLYHSLTDENSNFKSSTTNSYGTLNKPNCNMKFLTFRNFNERDNVTSFNNHLTLTPRSEEKNISLMKNSVNTLNNKQLLETLKVKDEDNNQFYKKGDNNRLYFVYSIAFKDHGYFASGFNVNGLQFNDFLPKYFKFEGFTQYDSKGEVSQITTQGSLYCKSTNNALNIGGSKGMKDSLQSSQTGVTEYYYNSQTPVRRIESSQNQLENGSTRVTFRIKNNSGTSYHNNVMDNQTYYFDYVISISKEDLKKIITNNQYVLHNEISVSSDDYPTLNDISDKAQAIRTTNITIESYVDKANKSQNYSFGTDVSTSKAKGSQVQQKYRNYYTGRNQPLWTATETVLNFNRSAQIDKKVLASYDRNNLNKSGAYYENKPESTTISKVSHDSVELGQFVRNENVIDNQAQVLPYSVIDGIHSTNYYRGSVIWQVDIKNDDVLPIDASHIVEVLDAPHKLFGYSITLLDDRGLTRGTINVKPNTEETFIQPSKQENLSYQSKVTGETVKGNFYEINLEDVLNSDNVDIHSTISKEDIIEFVKNLPYNYSLRIYFYSDMNEENLDWYYDTTYLLDTEDVLDCITQQQKTTYHATDGKDYQAIYDSDWVSDIASDGIKTFNKNQKSEKTSKEDFIKVKNAQMDKVATYTLEMGSYLYQTQNYKNAKENNIVFYDLLPGLSGGYKENEVGGGYSVLPDTYKAYILRTSGEKEEVPSNKYSVYYALDAMHGGRHPVKVDDSSYNVDFAKDSEVSWTTDYTDDVRTMKIVFDSSIELRNADRLYFEYQVQTRNDADVNVDYENVFGYKYSIEHDSDTSLNKNLYEDTAQVVSNIDTDIKFEKRVLDKNGNDITNEILSHEKSKEEFGEYTFKIREITSNTYQYNSTVSDTYSTFDGKEVKIPVGETLSLGQIAKKAELKLEEGKFYRIIEKNESHNIKTTMSVEGLTRHKETSFYSSTVAAGLSFQYETSEDLPLKITFTNQLDIEKGIHITKRQYHSQGNYDINKTSLVDGLSYIIQSKDGKYVKATADDYQNFTYIGLENEEYIISNVKGYINISDLPEGEYILKEKTSPMNYQKTEDIHFTVNNDDFSQDIFVNNYYNNTQLTLQKEWNGRDMGEVNVNIYQNNGEDLCSFIYKGSDSDGNKLYEYTNNTDDEKAVTLVPISSHYQTIVSHLKTNSYKIVEDNDSLPFKIRGNTVWVELSVNSSNPQNLISIEKTITNNSPYKLVNMIKKAVDGNNINAQFEIHTSSSKTSDKYKFKHYDELEINGITYNNIYEMIDTVDNSYTGEDSYISTSDSQLYVYYPQSVYVDGYVFEKNTDEGYLPIETSHLKLYTNENCSGSYSNYLGSYSNNIVYILNTVDTKDIQINKKDFDTSAPLEGVGFQIQDSEGNILSFEKDGDNYQYSKESTITALTTNADGHILVKNLPVDKDYKITENHSLDGYALADSKTIHLNKITTINDYGKPQEVSFTNKRSIGNVHVVKKNENNEEIPNVHFQFVKKANKNEILRFTKNSEGQYIYDENGQSDITYKVGGIDLRDIPLGNYILEETSAPEEYTLTEKEINLNSSSYYSHPYQATITNIAKYGNAIINKNDTLSHLIDTNTTVFKVYDKDNQLIRFNYNKEVLQDNGRVYEYDENGEYDRITTLHGKISLRNLPLEKGNYKIEEIVAPQGHQLMEGKVTLYLNSRHYFNPLVVNITNQPYQFGSENFVSSSYERIQEKDNLDNSGYGYFGKADDYAEGNTNYIYVDDKADIIRYTLNVGNMSKKNYEKMVLINVLPDINDTGVVNNLEQRNSEFTIKISNNPHFDIYMKDSSDTRINIDNTDYTIQYSDSKTFTNADWDGKTGDKWYDSLKDTTNSMRIVMNEDFELPSTYSLFVEFDGEIQENAQPGMIAWNSFAYRYYVGEEELTPEPPKVGVRIPSEPILRKEVINGADGVFTFDIIEKNTQEIVHTVSIKNGEEIRLQPKRTINGETTGYLEANKDYIIKERNSKQYIQKSVTGNGGKVYDINGDNVFEFTYDKDTTPNITFTNTERNLGQFVLTKVDKDNHDNVLANAQFELLNNNNEIMKMIPTNGGYKLATNDGYEYLTKMLTDERGQIHIYGLPYGTYHMHEIEAPDGYVLNKDSIKNIITFTIDDNAIEFKNNYYVANPIEKIAENTTTEIFIHKYSQGEIAGKTYNHNVNQAILQIWNQDKTEMIREIITDGSEKISVRGLKEGHYVLVESITPQGYIKANDIPFEITKDGILKIDNQVVTNQTINMNDEIVLGKVTISKTGEVMNDRGLIEQIEGYFGHLIEWMTGNLKDVEFKIYAAQDIYVGNTLIYSKDALVKTIQTGPDGTAEVDSLPLGRYYMTETRTGENYKLSKTPFEINLEYQDEETPIVVAHQDIFNERKQAKIHIHKTDEETQKDLSGAVFGLFVETTNQWYEKDTMLSVGMTDDKGMITFDTDIPVGNYYVKELKAPEGYVVSEEKTHFTFDKDMEVTLEITNSSRNIYIEKVDKEGQFVQGAKLAILNSEGQIIESWSSESESHKVKAQLQPGKTYILRELEAPSGYITAKDVTFTIKDIADIQKITMINEKTQIAVSKLDVTNGQEITGAHLEVRDETGQLIDKWTSTNKPHKIEGLTTGLEYTLIERIPANGYATAEEVKFTVLDDFEIQSVKMFDDITKIDVYKTDITDGKSVVGAHLEVRDENNQVIDKWITTDAPHRIERLVVGKTYTLIERLPGNGYVTAENVQFTVEDSGKIQKVEMKDDITKYEFMKYDDKGNVLEGAEFTIYDSQNQIIEKWISTQQPHHTERLIVGQTYIVKETVTPDGYQTMEDYVFTAQDTGEIVHIDFVNVKQATHIDENKKPQNHPTTPIQPNKPQKPEQPTVHQTPIHVVKTGDNLDIEYYIIIALCSILGISLYFFDNKRRMNK